MKKFHIAISTNKIELTIDDYNIRLGAKPCCYIPGKYALWHTDCLNVSVRQDYSCKCGTLRHLGWEDSSATESSEDTDINGIVWKRFSTQQQADEINAIWPESGYQPNMMQ
ncbi:MAG: hypothetical protein AAFO09_08535 [Pseudomonadota bacterium]